MSNVTNSIESNSSIVSKMKQAKFNLKNPIIVYLVLITIKTAQSRPSAGKVEILSMEHHQLQDEFPQKPTSYHFSKHMNPFMQVHKLSPTSNNITCNDGSQVGYYMRLNNHSKSWVIYLQGGGFCGSEESCQQRWQRSPHLMSSNFWPKTKTVDGILSSEPKENPYLWNANHIYVPYCSSDSWTGLAPANQQSDGENRNTFSFMGSKIVERVLDSLYDELPRESSLYEAKFILLAGDSAGATGVILNLDKVNEIVEQKANSIRANCSTNDNNAQTNCELKQPPVLRGLADSGWFLDNEPYDFGISEPYTGEQEANNGDCDRYRCTPLQSTKQAMHLWNGQVPPACASRHLAEPWRCYFGYRAYQTLKTPLFVVQWLYDEAQLMVDNIARPDTSGQWNYVNKVVNEMRASLENVTALFAPSCFSHSLVIRRNWNQININGFKLPHVLNSWEEQSLLDTTSAIASNKRLKLDENARFTINSDTNPPEKQQISSGLSRINISLPSIVNQPTFETLLIEQESSGNPNLATMYVRDTDRTQLSTSLQELRPISHKTSLSNAGNTNRSRSRKRKRNNQQQRPKQAQRQKSGLAVESYLPPTEPPVLLIARETNDLSSSSNPLQDLLPLIDRSLASADLLFGRLNRNSTNVGLSNGRLGRSTIVDDATLMLSNNMPDDNSASQMSSNTFEHKAESKWKWSGDSRKNPNTFSGGFESPNKYPNADRFRLIDSCGWPQCNRDCPVLDSDSNSGGFIQF